VALTCRSLFVQPSPQSLFPGTADTSKALQFTHSNGDRHAATEKLPLLFAEVRTFPSYLARKTGCRPVGKRRILKHRRLKFAKFRGVSCPVAAFVRTGRPASRDFAHHQCPGLQKFSGNACPCQPATTRRNVVEAVKPACSQSVRRASSSGFAASILAETDAGR